MSDGWMPSRRTTSTWLSPRRFRISCSRRPTLWVWKVSPRRFTVRVAVFLALGVIALLRGCFEATLKRSMSRNRQTANAAADDQTGGPFGYCWSSDLHVELLAAARL